jgi:hypothetical protein
MQLLKEYIRTSTADEVGGEEVEHGRVIYSTAPNRPSHSLTVLSPEADASSLPSGENATAETQSEWPLSVCRAAPDRPSHSLTVLSSEADDSSLPSGENATAVTQPEWPLSVCRAAPSDIVRPAFSYPASGHRFDLDVKRLAKLY